MTTTANTSNPSTTVAAEPDADDTTFAGLTSSQRRLRHLLTKKTAYEMEARTYSTSAAMLAHAIPGTAVPLPSDLPRGAEGQAFHDVVLAAATPVASARDLQYTEGYAYSPTLGGVFEHAWLQAADGTIHDPTWDRDDQTAYLGIRIPISELLAIGEVDDENDHDISITPVLFGDWLRRMAWHRDHHSCCQQHVTNGAA